MRQTVRSGIYRASTGKNAVFTAESGPLFRQTAQAGRYLLDHLTREFDNAVGVIRDDAPPRRDRRSAGRAAQVAQESRDVAQAVSQQIAALAQTSADIGGAVKLITSIADQTNLLALNATRRSAAFNYESTGAR
jgi:hypothetical protein